MNELDTNPGPSSSPPPQRGFWRRLFLRGLLVGGIGLVLLFACLIAITVPNLRCEVTPPEISGPEQVERNRTASSTAAPSGTLTSDAASTSGTRPLLNLDDYPHLSPTLRRLTQAWLDQLPATDKAFETISDPVLRAQIRAFLLESRQIQAYLNIPLTRDNPAENQRVEWTGYKAPNPAMPSFQSFEEWCQFLNTHPEFKNVFELEEACGSVIKNRMQFESSVHQGDWESAAYICAEGDQYSHINFPPLQIWGQLSGWEEEYYCLRQMGAPGWVCLAGRSYQRALDSQWGPIDSTFHDLIRQGGNLPIYTTVFFRDFLHRVR